MATIVPGYSFTPTETVTNTKLAQLASGTVTGITQSDSTAGMITVSSSAPTGSTGYGWFDTSSGAGRGVLRIFDNGVWVPVGEGFVGYNNGLTVSRGTPVVYDSSFVAGVTAGRIPFRRAAAPAANTATQERSLGVAAESIVNGATGVILTHGYGTGLKDAANITAGDAAMVSSTTSAQLTTGNVGSWGTPGGSSYFGRWLDTSAAAAGTEVAMLITGPTPASWVVFKNSGGTVLTNALVPTLNAWTATTVAPSAAPPGTIAHICQFFITSTTAAATGIVVGLRMTNSTVDIGTGAAHMRGVAVGSGAPTNYQGMAGQLIVPETTGASSNTMQYFVNSSAAAATFALTINEVGIVVGGQVV